ncbi:MAG TPA: hypothetical protein VHC97_16490 [Thermoanaerobaculia bacterium]|jgi:hypothetical protein|nr:hypothetical protein [Thermoanaerobaculia bacterium]
MSLLPLLRFHLAVGARLAMRVFLPVIVSAVGGGFLLGNDFLTSLSQTLYGPRSSGGSAAMIAAACLGAAAMASPRVCRGLGGWLRHLPVSGLAHRRAAGIAIAVAQAPLLLLFLFLAAFASRAGSTLVVDGLALAVTALAAAIAVVPARRRWASVPLALASAFTAGAGGWGLLAIGAVLAVAADLAAGPLARASGPPAVHNPRRTGGGKLELRIAWRAVGRTLPGAFFLGLLPLGAAWAFLAHNTLAPEHARLGARLGAGCAVVFLLSQIGESLAVRRPAWPWSRSLPGSAARRVISDALFLGLHALPLVLLALWINPSALWILAVLPVLAVRASGAVRRAPERRSGAAGEILGEGLFLSALVALVPWTALLALAATPFAVRAAAERERRQKVSRWLELHHLAAGDPQSWSAS